MPVPWPLCDCHGTVMWPACDCYVTNTCLLHDHYETVVALSCHLCVTVMWHGCDDGCSSHCVGQKQRLCDFIRSSCDWSKSEEHWPHFPGEASPNVPLFHRTRSLDAPVVSCVWSSAVVCMVMCIVACTAYGACMYVCTYTVYGCVYVRIVYCVCVCVYLRMYTVYGCVYVHMYTVYV